MMPLRKESGFVLVFVLFIFMILLIYGAMFVQRAISEWNVADRQRRVSQAQYITEAATEIALEQLDAFINEDLRTTINEMNPQLVAKKAKNAVTGGNGIGFLVDMSFDMPLGTDGTTTSFNQPSTSFSNGSYTYNIIVTEAGDPVLVAPDMWDFPYNYKIEATGQVTGTSKTITLTGDFTIRVQRDNFAKYALFSAHHRTPSGTIVWFTDTTNFAGPIHTNEHFSFAGDPALAGFAGFFDGPVTQHLSKALFYNSGWPILLDEDLNGVRDIPAFNQGFTRSYQEIVLASSVQKQDMYEQALGTHIPTGSGIAVANDGSSLTGGIYVDGDASIQLGIDANDHAQYTIQQGATRKIITVDNYNNQTTVVDPDTGSSATYTGLPDGIYDLGTIIYVNGSVTSLGGGTDQYGQPLPAIQRDTELTISCENDVVVTNHIRYSEFTDAVGEPGDDDYVPPNAEGTENLFGIVAWGGNVIIGNEAPDNVDIHGTILARSGMFTVDDYDNYGGSRGVTTLLGGVITEFYGPFGLFNSSTGQQLSGYGRNFVYDGRALDGKSPPYFPTLNAFTSFSNDLTDKIIYWEGSYY
ncbi:MAG: DUF4900 domain-containing protein [Candidatus Omnitrophota bacterium]